MLFLFPFTIYSLYHIIVEEISMSIRPRLTASLVCFAGLFALFCPCSGFCEPIKDNINQYFQALQKDFEKIAANHACKKPQTSAVNRLFVSTLKKHHTFYSLVRVSAKGVLVNEVDHGEAPKKVHKKINKPDWYVSAANNREYYGWVEEDGKFLLLWARAISLSKKRFGGVVAVKIDLWDCFHLLTGRTTDPFIIRVNGKGLYYHRLKEDAIVKEEPLVIPGVARASFLSEKSAATAALAAAGASAKETPAPSAGRDTGPAATVQPAADTAAKDNSVAPKETKHRTLFIIVGIVLAVIIIILLIQFYTWLNHRFLMRSINRDDPFIKR
jgi:hypothetical protein